MHFILRKKKVTVVCSLILFFLTTAIFTHSKEQAIGFDGINLESKKQDVVKAIKKKYSGAEFGWDEDDGTGRNNCIVVELNSDFPKQIVYFFDESGTLYFIGLKISEIDEPNYFSLKKNIIEKYGDPIFDLNKVTRWKIGTHQEITISEDSSYTAQGLMVHYKNKLLWDKYEASLNKDKFKKF
ncbi:hypothetical protein [Leptospira sp. GIMC2001]|uniref:hypothetical protein n=1 Tax=Leptospira sp. GIMC2001 TaxID=1513297 RepID=UPI00234AD96D|nr:hypothetical protein [Leptospira sp. GIMC2001]WCL51463.1 hypothetical protein O4O04_20315 [Leptospira sp. GIMC2001]